MSDTILPAHFTQHIRQMPIGYRLAITRLCEEAYMEGQKKVKTDFIYLMGLADLADEIRNDCAQMIEDTE